MLDYVKERLEDTLKRHPIAYATVGLIFALVNIFIWMAGVWALFSDEKLPAVFFRLGVSRMSLYASATLLFIFTVSSIGLFIAVLRSVKKHREEVRWLERIAEEDSSFMGQRIIIGEHSHSVIPHWEAMSPYVILRTFVLNSSVYPLTLEDKVEGWLVFNGRQLPEQPLVCPARNETRTTHIDHGKTVQIELRQTIPHAIVENVKRGEPLQTGQVALWFTYQFRPSFTRRVRVSLPGPFVAK